MLYSQHILDFLQHEFALLLWDQLWVLRACLGLRACSFLWNINDQSSNQFCSHPFRPVAVLLMLSHFYLLIKKLPPLIMTLSLFSVCAFLTSLSSNIKTEGLLAPTRTSQVIQISVLCLHLYFWFIFVLAFFFFFFWILNQLL